MSTWVYISSMNTGSRKKVRTNSLKNVKQTTEFCMKFDVRNTIRLLILNMLLRINMNIYIIK